jgi:hypothetical protein
MWENLSLSDKEQYLIKSQLQTLKMFRDRNAITHEQYEEALEYGDIIMLSLGTLLSKVCGKIRIPKTDILRCIKNGIPEIA